MRLQTSGTECRFMIMHLTRRHFLQTTSLALASAHTHVFAAEDPLIESIEKVVLKTPALPKGTWFHPRACMVGKKAFMTTQPIVGSDHFGHVHWTTSDDLGQTWSDFTPAPPLGWEKLPDGLNEAVCDITPEFHPQTGSVLALGQHPHDRCIPGPVGEPRVLVCLRHRAVE